MAIITAMSASGAPGTSTTCLALASAWPRPVVVVDADVSGSNLYLGGYFGGAVGLDRSINNLVMAHRAGQLDEGILSNLVTIPNLPFHRKVTAPTRQLLPGVRTPFQAVNLRGVWRDLGWNLQEISKSQGVDVIVDLGRLGAENFPDPLLEVADAALLVMRSVVPGLTAAQAWLSHLREDSPGGAGRLGLVVVGPGRPYGEKEIAKVLATPVVFTMPWDPAMANAYGSDAGFPRHAEGRPLFKAADSAASTLIGSIAEAARRLNPMNAEERR